MKKWIALLTGLSLIMTLAVFAGTGMAAEETAGETAAPVSYTHLAFQRACKRILSDGIPGCGRFFAI